VINDKISGDVSLNILSTGGVGDLFFMRGADPNQVTKQFHKVIGFPVLAPQWALGWHQSRQGYFNIRELEDVVQNFTSMDLPLEAIWADIAYQDKYLDFTVDPRYFLGLEKWVNDTLHAQSMKFVPIIEAGVAIRPKEEYLPYIDGEDQGVFIKDASGNDVFVGSGWALDVAFPDFLAENTTAWWNKWIGVMHNITLFDGLWLNTNEASNFLCNGVCYQRQASETPVSQKLAYIPTGRDLEEKSISLDAVHATGDIDLDVHSLFGTMQTAATKQWFDSNDKRPMIISRSSYSGMGKFGSTWLGDNLSDAVHMGDATTGVMAQNIAGIPLSGSDICGDIGNSSAELCTRWYVNGAFYPFSRNHNRLGYTAQEPWAFDNDPVYENTTTYKEII